MLTSLYIYIFKRDKKKVSVERKTKERKIYIIVGSIDGSEKIHSNKRVTGLSDRFLKFNKRNK